MPTAITFETVSLVLTTAAGLCSPIFHPPRNEKTTFALATVLFVVGVIFAFLKYPSQPAVVCGSVVVALLGLAQLLGLAARAVTPWVRRLVFGYRILIISDGGHDSINLAHLLIERSPYVKSVHFWSHQPIEDLPNQVKAGSSSDKLKIWIGDATLIYYFLGEDMAREVASLIKVKSPEAIVAIAGRNHDQATIGPFVEQKLRLVVPLVYQKRALTQRISALSGVEPSQIELTLFGTPKRVIAPRSVIAPLSLQRVLTDGELERLAQEVHREARDAYSGYRYSISLVELLAQFVDGELDAAIPTDEDELWGGRLTSKRNGANLKLKDISEKLSDADKARIAELRVSLRSLA